MVCKAIWTNSKTTFTHIYTHTAFAHTNNGSVRSYCCYELNAQFVLKLQPNHKRMSYTHDETY